MTRRGFTLLEVMVAVAILGLGLTAILSAQAGAFAASTHARNISLGTGLARCKMSEIEEHLMRDGFQELDENETGPCCEGDETPNVHCAWKIEKPELPEPKLGELNLDTDLDSAQLGPLGAMGAGEQGKELFTGDAGVGAIAQTLIGGATDPTADPAAQGGGAGGIAAMAMSLVYPDLKTLFEASIRRATVTLSWTEGQKDYSIELVQWISIPQAGMAADQAADAIAQEQQDQAEASQMGGTKPGGGGGTKPGGGGGTKPGGGGGTKPSPAPRPRP